MHKLKQWYQDLNLQSKFTLVLLLIVSIPGIAIIFFFYGRAYDMVVSYTIRQEQDRSAETAPLIEESIQKVLDVSEEISSLDFYQTLFKNAITESFTDLADSLDAASFSRKIDQLIADTPVTNVKIYMEMPKGSPSDINALLDKEDLKDTFLSLDQIRGTYWYGIFRGSRVSQLFCPSFYLGTKEQKAYGDQAYITHASVIYNNGTYDAYMAVYYSGHDFQQILSENLTLDGSVSYIMNERNNLVSASSDSLAGIYWLDYDKIMESYMSSNSFVEQDILGKTVYVGFYRIKQPGWFMVTVLPSQPLINQSNILVLQFLSIYIAVLALAFLLASTLSKSITGRISSVISQMRTVRHGPPVPMDSPSAEIRTEVTASQMRTVRHGPPVPMDSPSAHDEIGDLIDTYNYMTRKMNQLMEKQAQAAEDLRIAEFNSLQAQINPHFLYNTMDMINWMAQQGRTSEVCNAVQSLSRFYKLTLSRKKGISTIAKEEEHVSIYVHLQNMRYHDSISFISDIPDELMEYQIPKLTLQPVIENSILHGILEKPSKSGTIVLTGWMEDGDIVLLISDDGVGIAPDKLPVILSGEGTSISGGTNIAIYNTHRRLQVLYGADYGLTYSSDVGKGTELWRRLWIDLFQRCRKRNRSANPNSGEEGCGKQIAVSSYHLQQKRESDDSLFY